MQGNCICEFLVCVLYILIGGIERGVGGVWIRWGLSCIVCTGIYPATRDGGILLYREIGNTNFQITLRQMLELLAPLCCLIAELGID